MCWIKGHLDPGLSRRSLRGRSQLEDMGKARKVIMQKAHDRLQSELLAQINIVCLIILGQVWQKFTNNISFDIYLNNWWKSLVSKWIDINLIISLWSYP